MTRTVSIGVAGLVGLCLLGTAACGSPARTAAASTSAPATARSATPPLTGTVTVFADSSLRATFTSLARSFETVHPGTRVRLTFGASSSLAQRIRDGAPAGVFAAASTAAMRQVARDVAAPVNLVSDTAEIAVAPRARATVTSLADLVKPGVTVALCQPQLPCGVLAATVLQRAGVTLTPAARGLDAASTLAEVTDGRVEAALVYLSTVKAAGAGVVGVAVPAADDASSEYPIATVKDVPDAALAAAFLQYVDGAAGKAVLTGAGFSAP